MESIGLTAETLSEQFREPAEQAVRVDLALRAVAVAEDLIPDDAAVSEAIAEMSTQAGQDPSELEARLTEFGQISALRADLAKQNALEWLTVNVELINDEGATIQRSELEFPTTEADGASVSGPEDESEVEEATDQSTEDSE